MSIRQIHVLVAEDDATDQRLLIELCGNFGWNVESIDNGHDVVERVAMRLKQNHPFDCILLDWHMPVMDGLTALAGLKQTLDKRTLAVIMVTEHDIDTLNRAVTDVKPDSVLVKPVEPSRLFNHVNQAVVAHGGDLGYVLSGTRIDPGHSHWLDGLRILAVDDSQLNLTVIERTLLSEGALPTICLSGAAALQAINQADVCFDLVLMDMQMPGMDGCETTQRIRADGRYNNLPILALTAGATTTEQARAKGAGMNGFLTKPISPPNLVRAIRLHVEQYRGESLPLIPYSAVPSAVDNGQLVLQSASLEQDGWPNIAGIDSARSNNMLQGDAELLFEILKIFVAENAEAGSELSTLVDGGDYAEAAKCVHRLGGQCGNIGASELHQLARSLERALQSETDDIAEILAIFNVALAGLLKHINKTLAN